VYNGIKEKKMTLRKFLVMVEDDVAGEMVFEDSFSYNQKMYNALLNNEVNMLKIDPDFIVERGDIWNGTSFDKPSSI
jgi:hypothetical protein